MTILSKALSAIFRSGVLNGVVFNAPARYLYDRDGTCYMRRWHIIREGTFASRVLQRLTGYASIRLHHLLREDHDREPHNHPFNYRTFVLDGYYTEAYRKRQGKDVLRDVLAGETATGNAEVFHRITEVAAGGVWTLFCMTPNTDAWGFLSKGKYVPSAKYLARNGFDATNPR